MDAIRHFALCCSLAAAALLASAAAARAQDPPPRIGPFVVDLHGVVPTFSDDPLLAQSRSLLQPEMPGFGLGLTAGVHVYMPKVLGIVFGFGGEVLARARTSSRRSCRRDPRRRRCGRSQKR